jgi:hypothetical protein
MCMITARQSNGYCPAEHRGCGERSKVATVEGVGGLPVHDKDVAVGNDVASLPDWKWAASPIAFLSMPNIDAIDRD